MTRPSRTWNELSLSETPALALLEHLGYTRVPPEALESPDERESLRQPILTARLARAIRALNPWMSPTNIAKAVNMIARVDALSLIDANRHVYERLTYGESVLQDLGEGQRGKSFRFIDFENPEANELLVVSQYRVKGAGMHIKPDVTLFVNGIPLVVIECKSPTLGEKWKTEAVTQLRRYQECDESYRNQGAPQLFHTAQILVATCGQSAYYGTTNTASRSYMEWKQPWPASEDQLPAELPDLPQGIRAQERLLYSVLRPANLLDIVKNFVVFETRNGVQTKKLCRYKQFIAANEAIARIAEADRPTERGGVVWHTQGSGKSLTMLWLALKLRRDPRLENPGLVIVTDRTSLDKQIVGTFERAGMKVDRAETVRELRDLLANVIGKTVMTTIQKFQELRSEGARGATGGTQRADRTPMPMLNDAANIVVMVDEAHRSQYRSLATNMRTALPNAAFIGFTGTPIDKKDKSTLQTFGPYIDRYTIEQAVADGATVEIRYEGRMPELRIEGGNLDWLFEREFSDRTKEERAQIQKKFATPQALAEAPKRVTAICQDLIEHFEQAIAPNGFKAQLAVGSRDAAVTYYDTITRLRGPSTAVVISARHNDKEKFAPHTKTQKQIDDLVDAFCDADQEPQILIVCDRLLTGFDAPIEQVLYIDKSLREHSLLQAIARTNRRYDDTKTHGLVVDYWGISDKLDEALSLFTAEDVQGAMTPKADELPRLEARHQTVLRFFDGVKNKTSLDQCVRALEDDDVFAGFEAGFRKFAQSLDMLYPDRAALRFVPDAKWLGKVLKAARARADRAGPDLSDCGAKVRRLIEEAVVADGVQILVSQVPLLSAEFEKKIEALGSDEAKASEMEHAIRHEIHVKIEEDPAFYESLRERLERIVEDYKEGRITAAEKFQLALELSTEFSQGQAKSADGLELGARGFAIFGLLRAGGLSQATRAGEASPGYGSAQKQKNAQLRDLASLIDDAIDPFTKYVDWRKKNDVLKEMKRRVAKQLRGAGHEPDEAKRLAADIVRLASARIDLP